MLAYLLLYGLVGSVFGLNADSFREYMNEEFFFVYLRKQGCEFCGAFDVMFEGAKQMLKEERAVVLGELNFTPENEKIFKKLQVESVPDVKVFKKGVLQPYSYSSIRYDESAEKYLTKWIKLVMGVRTKPLNKASKMVVYPCSAPYTSEIKLLSFDYLDFHFECQDTSTIRILQGEKTVKEFSCQEWDKCKVNIMNTMNQGTYQWSSQHIYDIYHRTFFIFRKGNTTVFVLIANKDNQSCKMSEQFRRIKSEWDLEASSSQIPHFAIANLSTNQRETNRLRTFIGGFINYFIPYPFPMLAALRVQEGQLVKYLYETKYMLSPKNIYSIQEWMNRVVYNQQQKFRRGQQALSLSNFQKRDKNEGQKKKKQSQIRQSNYEELIELLESQERKPIAVLYFWRYDESVVKIYQGTSENFMEAENSLIFLAIDLEFSELPPGVILTSIPALLLYNENREPVIHNGLVSSQEIVEIISNFVSGPEQKFQTQQQL